MNISYNEFIMLKSIVDRYKQNLENTKTFSKGEFVKVTSNLSMHSFKIRSIIALEQIKDDSIPNILWYAKSSNGITSEIHESDFEKVTY